MKSSAFLCYNTLLVQSILGLKLRGGGGGYWLKLGVATCFLQCSVEREPQEITRQIYIFLERS